MSIESFKQDLDSAYEGETGTLDVGPVYSCQYSDGTIRYYRFSDKREVVKNDLGEWVDIRDIP